MSMRTRRAALCVKIQTTAETFDAPDAATDGILIEPPTIRYNPQNTTTNEVTASLDNAADIVGGMQVNLSFLAYLKGNAAPGTVPQWGNLLRICGWKQTATKETITGITFSVTGTDTVADSADGLADLTVGSVFTLQSPKNPNAELIVTASAAGSLSVSKPDGSAAGLVNEAAGGTFTLIYGVVGTDATAGDATGFTAAAPWAATAQLYRGMPVLISGNPAAAAWSSIIDYLSSRVATLADTFGTALDDDSVVSIPANVLWTPTSDDTEIPMGSFAVYMDGVEYKFSDGRGTLTIAMTAGKTWAATFNISALYVGKVDAAVPTVTYDATRPGVWKGSKFLINRLRAAVSSFNFDNGATLVFPDDPNAAEGFSSPEHTARKMTFTADPLMTLVATRDITTAFRNGDQQPIHASLFGGQANKPGNRIIFNIPTAQYSGDDPGDRNGLATEQLSGQAVGPDAGAFIAVY